MDEITISAEHAAMLLRLDDVRFLPMARAMLRYGVAGEREAMGDSMADVFLGMFVSDIDKGRAARVRRSERSRENALSGRRVRATDTAGEPRSSAGGQLPPAHAVDAGDTPRQAAVYETSAVTLRQATTAAARPQEAVASEAGQLTAASVTLAADAGLAGNGVPRQAAPGSGLEFEAMAKLYGKVDTDFARLERARKNWGDMDDASRREAMDFVRRGKEKSPGSTPANYLSQYLEKKMWLQSAASAKSATPPTPVPTPVSTSVHTPRATA